MKHCRMIVHGHVQGVGFRYYAKVVADRLGICGWVRNLWDGTVEIESEGDSDCLNEYIEMIQLGNKYSQVEHIETSFADHVANYRSFDIIE